MLIDIIHLLHFCILSIHSGIQSVSYNNFGFNLSLMNDCLVWFLVSRMEYPEPTLPGEDFKHLFLYQISMKRSRGIIMFSCYFTAAWQNHEIVRFILSTFYFYFLTLYLSFFLLFFSIIQSSFLAFSASDHTLYWKKS